MLETDEVNPSSPTVSVTAPCNWTQLTLLLAPDLIFAVDSFSFSHYLLWMGCLTADFKHLHSHVGDRLSHFIISQL